MDVAQQGALHANKRGGERLFLQDELGAPRFVGVYVGQRQKVRSAQVVISVKSCDANT